MKSFEALKSEYVSLNNRDSKYEDFADFVYSRMAAEVSAAEADAGVAWSRHKMVASMYVEEQLSKAELTRTLDTLKKTHMPRRIERLSDPEHAPFMQELLSRIRSEPGFAEWMLKDAGLLNAEDNNPL